MSWKSINLQNDFDIQLGRINKFDSPTRCCIIQKLHTKQISPSSSSGTHTLATTSYRQINSRSNL